MKLFSLQPIFTNGFREEFWLLNLALKAQRGCFGHWLSGPGQPSQEGLLWGRGNVGTSSCLVLRLAWGWHSGGGQHCEIGAGANPGLLDGCSGPGFILSSFLLFCVEEWNISDFSLDS